MAVKNGGSSQKFLLRMDRLSKKYGNVKALHNVSLALSAGEIVALIGDNGAGKSTLLKCLSGVVSPDEGFIEVGGKRFAGLTPRESIRCGIAAVYQDLALVEELDVAANIFLGMEPLLLGLAIDRKRMYREAASLLENLGINLPFVRIETKKLSGGQRQAVAVARAVARSSLSGAKGLILFDEPTAAMGVRESAAILAVLSDLRARGYALFCISHNIPQIFALADRICIMRSGEIIWSGDRGSISIEEAISLVSGVSAHA